MKMLDRDFIERWTDGPRCRLSTLLHKLADRIDMGCGSDAIRCDGEARLRQPRPRLKRIRR